VEVKEEMSKTLLFIPDISGFTNFVQTTEVEHSQHVIAELLEILIASNTQNLKLAEVEGDALFFFKEDNLPSQEKLLAQIETMYTAFYGHLKLLEKNRICPCNACSMAPKLELKILAHCGIVQNLEVQGKRKPFGQAVIEAHRLLKNSVESDNYVIISNQLAEELKMPLTYSSRLFNFVESSEHYDNKELKFSYSEIDNSLLKTLPYASPKVVTFERKPNLSFVAEVQVKAHDLLELITNYKYRQSWVKGIDDFQYNESEVTRIGTEHLCVINGKHLNFTTVTKMGNSDEMVYGELTDSSPILDLIYQFYIVKPLSKDSCKVTAEVYWIAKSAIKKTIMKLLFEKQLAKNIGSSLINLKALAEKSGE
jgi:ribosome-associated toxin RatA of RatAB toxin-antitoxin module